jgi:diguanylate cyclase (GGDEF)-like protein/PAS domain S-box-containing protein
MTRPASILPSRLPSRLMRWLEPYAADEARAPRFRARQLRAVLRLTPLGMLTNIVLALLVLGLTWEVGHHGFLLAWTAVMMFVTAHGLYGWWRFRRGPPRPTASPRALRRAAVAAGVLGCCWAVLIAVQFPLAPPPVQLILATVVTGMIGAGGLALATVPLAGAVYALTLGLGAGVAVLRSDLALAPVTGLALLLYCAIVVASVRTAARGFGARLLAEAAAEQHRTVAELLLHDFEANAGDVLWQTGADGCLRHVSPHLSRVFGRSLQELTGIPLRNLLRQALPDDDEAHEHLAQLEHALQRREPFRGLLLPVTARGGATRWWALTARPLQDEHRQRNGWRGVASDVSAAREATQQLSWLAHNDPLTGLANRHQLRKRLDAVLANLRAGPAAPSARVAAHAILCLDLDHLKAINDRLGHAAGDALLRSVGQRLRGVARRSDVVARLGGDEFAILLVDIDAAEVEGIVQRLLDALRAPCTVDGLQLSAQASVGVALAPRDGTEVDELLNHADQALYAVKAAGRNASREYSPELSAVSRRRAQIELALRGAIERGELALAFQPQMRMADRALTGCEALLRWQHAELGAVPPLDFIPVAEDAGLMPRIGQWVLQQACRAAAQWPQAVVVSVNVSPRQMLGTGFIAQVHEALQQSGLPAGRLELEITESLLLDETPATRQTLQGLREAGVRIALDDFGTGYSALGYLSRFPFDTLKIDRSFVRELGARADADAIVRMILGLAQTLGMQTVAEGVEEPEQARLLQRQGCDLMQGYLLARPLPQAELLRFLQDWPAAAAALPRGEAQPQQA